MTTLDQGNDAAVPAAPNPLDEDLYSRQLYVLGADAMKKMADSHVFLSGLGGLGVEIAKNVALAGVKTLTIHDTLPTTHLDLSTQFFLTEADVGKNRAEASLSKLNELNPYTPVSLKTDDLATVDLSLFDSYSVVCLTEVPLAVQLRISDYCHQKGIKFISSEVRGVFGVAFVDCGKDFEIFDSNGEQLVEVIVDKITNETEAVVTTLPGKRHGLSNHDFVTLSEVVGMEALNGTTHRVKVKDQYSFTIGDTTQMGAYVKGGLVHQQRAVEKISYPSLRESLDQPEFNFTDYAKFGNPAQLLLALRSLHTFADCHEGILPGVWSREDGAEFLKIAAKLNSENKEPLELNEELFLQVAYTSRGALVGVSAYFGGVVAQEILKSVSGKFTPLKGFMFMDVSELVPSTTDFDETNFKPTGTRSDGQRIVLGDATCQLLAEGKLFMIGCGAIGCEMFKNYAMLGFGTAEAGLITCTDNDLIEKSNLNRQFLFRSKDISHPKSTSAAAAAQTMNAALRIEAHTSKVGPESESTYTDAFFASQSVIVNALDNVEARLYVDQRCVDNGKALMESGTMGTKGHVQNILPHLTANYSMTQDPPETGFPFCTLKSFPYKSEHTIQWARDKFTTNFTLKPQETDQFLRDSSAQGYWEKFVAAAPPKPDVARAIRLLSINPTTYEDCVKLSVNKFTSYFRNSILQLIFNYPSDFKDKDGKLFWSAPRRFPVARPFDSADPQHLQFVVHSAALYAQVYNITPTITDLEKIRAIAAAVPIPEYQIKRDKHIESDENADEDQVKAKKREKEVYKEGELEQMVETLKSLVQVKKKLTPEDFEKDVDSNHHIDYITAASNIRSSSYELPLVDRLQTKRIAGKIIPAMATSTAAISGLVSIELIKVLLGFDQLELYKNAWMNLALPMVMLSEPQACPAQQIGDELTITLWTKRWEVKKGNLALGQFLNHFKKTYKLIVTGIFYNVTMIYAAMMPGHSKRKPQRMEKLLAVADPSVDYVDLTCSFEDFEGNDVVGPAVRYWLKK
eukprot:TRINITY_DN1830_c0_g1_i1.p1 TRINITY_DN1830_c0_g1~~TRINITY_DN1830_c0_g1_i1.p1  ORF type:complete len:1025 (+),score=229.32 TRINITY_DN1830_c0_g1_i1:40-3114(+)